MAIEFVDVEIGGKTKLALVVETVEGVDRVILRDTLMSADLKYLDEVDAGEGADFAEKLKATKLTIGVNAEDFFASRIASVADLDAAAKRSAVKRNVVGSIIALQESGGGEPVDLTEITQRVTDVEIKADTNETEIGVLSGRVDGIDQRVTDLENAEEP